jgi:hypothetical protein
MTVQIIENFVSDSDADTIVQGLIPFLVKSGINRPAMAETQFEGPSPDPVRLMFTEIVNRVAKEINNFYEVDVVPIQSLMAQTSKGGKNDGLHCDSVQIDGRLWQDVNPKLDSLEFSALVYLNESGTDYSGGEIRFPNQELVIKPQTGQMIFFRGDVDHPHGVSEVTSGERYALVLFYARQTPAAVSGLH